MRNPPLVPSLALALSIALPAQSWSEAGDAGDLPDTVQAVLGSGPLTHISGTLGTGDVDLYLIHVDDPATFTCTSVGGATFDTQLWIFDRLGHGISFKDDDGVLQSTLTGQFLGAAGHVIVGISCYDNDPLDAGNQELWLDQPYDVERQPDGPGAANAFTHWGGTTNPSGAYTLTLGGASYAAPVTALDPLNAWAWVYPPNYVGQQLFAPSVRWQYTPTGELVWVNHIATGRFEVRFPAIPNDGQFQATAYRGNHAAVIEAWGLSNGKLRCYVDVFDAAGNLADLGFTLHYRRGGQPTDLAGYLWADQPANAQYTPSTNYSWNGNRPDPTITRYGSGLYRCRFPGIANPYLGGSFQVTAYTGYQTVQMRRAKIDSWGVITGTTDLDIFVRTFDGAGNQVDSMFVLDYHVAPGQIPTSVGSGAYVWANQPTAASYSAPSGHNRSNGTYGPHNSQTITRLGTGVYQVDLPDVAFSDSTVATAVARVQNGNYATVQQWTGTAVHVFVETYNAAGVPTDAEFFLDYTTSHPAGALATNAVIGAGCGDSLLVPTSRPILGTNWTMQVSSTPAGTSLGFVLIGLGDPNLDLTPLGMTGCVRHTDQLGSVLLLGPFPGATYGMAIPASPTFLGLPIHTQAALLAPGVNPIGVAASNGLRGTVGDV